MEHRDRVTPRQLTALAFVSLLSPLIRRFPKTMALRAWRACWLSIPLAVVPLGALALLYWLLLRRQRTGTGFAELLETVLGRWPGRIVTGIYALWFLCYGGFLLRSGAVRLRSTIYPGVDGRLFVICMSLACSLAVFGSLRALTRSAMLLRPLLAAAPVLLFLLALRDADFHLLLPVTTQDLAPVGMSALELGNLFTAVGFLAFLGSRLDAPIRFRHWAGWATVLLGLTGLMTLACLGIFGPALTASLNYPFFMLARDTTVLGSLERVEPAVVALWVFADFVMISALLWTAARLYPFRCIPGSPAVSALFCGVLAAGVGILLPEDLETFSALSDQWVPLVSAAAAAGIPLLTLAVGALRKKL